jgi:flagellar protein FliO/FliZ
MSFFIFKLLLNLNSLSLAADEADIPVPVKVAQAAATSEGSLQKLLLSAVVLLVGGSVLVWLLKRYKAKNVKEQQYNIKILSQFHLNPKRSFAVVSVAGESILVGMTDHHISPIKVLSLIDDEIEVETPKDFDKVLDRSSMMGKSTGQAATDKEGFSFQFVQDIVGAKMKHLKDLG